MAKKNKYRLQIVLDQKEEARDQAATVLQEKKENLKKEQEKADEIRRNLEATKARREKEYLEMTQGSLKGGIEVDDAQRRLNFIKSLDAKEKRLQEDLSVQIKRVKKAEQEVEIALQDLIQASRELQVMQRHKENWEKEVKRRQEEKDQNEMNEIGNVMYNAKHSIGQ